MQNSLFMKMLSSNAPAAVIIIRILVGSVFIAEGVQKFLFPSEGGFGRFEKLGFITPSITTPFLGTVEIVFGILLIAGLLTRLSTIPLLINITVIFTRKIMLIVGFWKFAHEAGIDYSMIICLIFLFIVGGGALSIDNLILRRKQRAEFLSFRTPKRLAAQSNRRAWE